MAVVLHLLPLIGLLGTTGPDLCGPIVLGDDIEAVGGMIEQLAVAWDRPYVYAASADARARRPLPHMTARRLSGRACLAVGADFAGLTPWFDDGLVVWFATGDCPSILRAEAGADGQSACPGPAEPGGTSGRIAALDLVDATGDAAIREIARAYEVTVVYSAACSRDDRLFTRQCPNGTLADTLAWLGEECGWRSRTVGEAVLLDVADVGAAAPGDSRRTAGAAAPPGVRVAGASPAGLGKLVSPQPPGGTLPATDSSAGTGPLDAAGAAGEVAEVLRLLDGLTVSGKEEIAAPPGARDVK